MDVNEQIELLADVWKDQVDNSMNENSLEDKVEVKSVNFSIEEKLDKIIATSEDIAKTNKECLGVFKELLEKLVPQSITINSPISVKSENKNVGVDISKHLYDLANKVQRRKGEAYSLLQELNPSKEESLERATGVNWFSSTEPRLEKILKPKIKIVCNKSTLGDKDEKGEIFTLEGTVQEDGNVVCEPMTESRTIVGWSLKKKSSMNDYKIFNPIITELKKEVQYIKDRYNAPVEILEELIKKVHTMLLDYEAAYEEQRQYSDRLKRVAPAISITKTIDVFKQQVDTNMFVYVGTMTDNVLTLNLSAVVLETHVTKPSTYFTGWFVKNNNPAIGCQWSDVHPSNTVNEILIKEKYMDKLVTTGYLTDDGRAVYYDQYL